MATSVSRSNEHISLWAVESDDGGDDSEVGREENFSLLLAERMMASWLLQWPSCHKGVSKALLTKNRGIGAHGSCLQKISYRNNDHSTCYMA